MKSSKIAFGVVVLLVSSLCTAAASEDFWQRSQGVWLSNNTYLDGDLNPKIAHYRSLVEITRQAENIVTHEIKFYPPGSVDFSQWGMTVASGRGVQMNTTTVVQLRADGSAVEESLNPMSHNSRTTIVPIGNDSALLRVTDRSQPTDSYRMFITLPDANTRVISNIGIVPFDDEQQGAVMRGFAFFSGHRLDSSEIPNVLERLQAEYKVGLIVTIDAVGKRTLMQVD